MLLFQLMVFELMLMKEELLEELSVSLKVHPHQQDQQDHQDHQSQSLQALSHLFMIAMKDFPLELVFLDKDSLIQPQLEHLVFPIQLQESSLLPKLNMISQEMLTLSLLKTLKELPFSTDKLVLIKLLLTLFPSLEN